MLVVRCRLAINTGEECDTMPLAGPKDNGSSAKKMPPSTTSMQQGRSDMQGHYERAKCRDYKEEGQEWNRVQRCRMKLGYKEEGIGINNPQNQEQHMEIVTKEEQKRNFCRSRKEFHNFIKY
ncbi:uncharacterized protein [Drosophila pseudoobscura]|uniref:Uncharacterized protein isoform X1 n=2 Tax=Drosophila pseudoobscura pseudoobscura TaxID=46245 RepID=A0A6I8V8K2_DROPS|nr:uncharacterized protein LOC26533703 isoform X1 [Drosophila pseudoobscura]